MGQYYTIHAYYSAFRNKQQSEESSRSQPMRGPSGSKNNPTSDTKQRTHPEPSGASRATRQPSGEARRYNENGEYRPTEEEEAMLSHLPISANKKERNMSISRSGRHKIRRSRSSVMEEQVYSSGKCLGVVVNKWPHTDRHLYVCDSKHDCQNSLIEISNISNFIQLLFLHKCSQFEISKHARVLQWI